MVHMGGSRAEAVLGALPQRQAVLGGPGDICAHLHAANHLWLPPGSVCFPPQQRRGRALLRAPSLPGRRAPVGTWCLSFPLGLWEGRGVSSAAPVCCVLWHQEGDLGVQDPRGSVLMLEGTGSRRLLTAWPQVPGSATQRAVLGLSPGGSGGRGAGGRSLPAGLSRLFLQDPCPACSNPAPPEALPAPSHPAQPNTSAHGGDGAGTG